MAEGRVPTEASLSCRAVTALRAVADQREPLAQTEQVAEYFGIPVQTIYDQRRRGAGVGALGFKVGKHLRFRWEDIDRFVAEQQAA